MGDGPERARLEELARSLGLGDMVSFAGFVSTAELFGYYHLCEVFIMPSYEAEAGDFEGYGRVYLEANALGKPVVGARSGGVGDAVLDGETGVLVPPQDAEAIAQAVIKLFQHREWAVELGLNGRKRVEMELSSEAIANRVLGVMQDVIGGGVNG